MFNDDLNDFHLSKEVKDKLKNKKTLKKELSEGKTAQEVLEISNDTMMKFYSAAYYLFENRHYDDAANAFFFLVTLNPHGYDYWVGLGMAEQLKGDFEAAIDAYEMAAMLETENPSAYLYLAKCLFAMHDRESALDALNLGISIADDRPEYYDLKLQMEAAKKLLGK